MRQKLDGKFHGVIVKNKDGSTVPQDQWVVFLAKDNAFPATLDFYRLECERVGARGDQLKAVDDLIDRVKAWRKANPDKCKVPDVRADEIVT
jgi:hypothetical protein